MSGTTFFVSSGSYSDYSVVAVFSSREKAEAFIASHVALGGEYRDAAGTWSRPAHGNGWDYQIEEADLDPVFGARGCYMASLTIENTHAATMPTHSWNLGQRNQWVASSHWTEDTEADAPATAERSPWHGDTSVTGYGRTREEAFAAADALRLRIVSGEVDPPFPAWHMAAQSRSSPEQTAPAPPVQPDWAAMAVEGLNLTERAVEP